MSSDSSSLAQNMRATTEGFLYAWNGDWTSETNRRSLSYRAPQCQHIMRPATVATPPRSNEEWSEYFTHIEGKVFNGKMAILDYFADLSNRRAVAHSVLTATAKGVGEWSNEYMWLLDFDETGEKITIIKEMLDSAATQNIRAALKAAETK